MPVRSVIKRTKTSVRHGVASYKNSRRIGCESNLERDLALLLEFSPNIVTFEEQPQRFLIPGIPASFHTTPDFAVTLDTGEIIMVEVKYMRKAIELSDRHEQIAEHLSGLGFRYFVLTERHIRFSQTVLDNCLYLKGFKSRKYHAVAELRDLVPTRELTLSELIESVGDETIAAGLIAHQLVHHDFNKNLGPKSLLRPARENDFNYMTDWINS